MKKLLFQKRLLNTYICIYTHINIYVYTQTMFSFLNKMKNVHHLWTFNRLEFFKTISIGI